MTHAGTIVDVRAAAYDRCVRVELTLDDLKPSLTIRKWRFKMFVLTIVLEGDGESLMSGGILCGHLTKLLRVRCVFDPKTTDYKI